MDAVPLPPLTPAPSPGGAQPTAVLAPDQRPPTPTSPVQIPIKASGHETAHTRKSKHRHYQDPDSWRSSRQSQARSSSRRQSHLVYSPDSIPPSVAALLANTSIPPPRPSRSLRQSRNFSGDRLSEKRMTVNSIIERAQEVEQEFSMSLSKSPLDVLLTAPEDLEDDDDAFISDSTPNPTLSTRTVSLESMPSLSDSVVTGTISSYDSPLTPTRRPSGRKARPTRRSLTPVSSPPGQRVSDHPLSMVSTDGASDSDVDVDSLDFRVFQPATPDPLAKTTESRFPLQPLKSAFKSNLTASLRALRNAARAFPNFNLTSIPPEDFLTRSLLTIDPRIPYTDERRPPPLEEEPSAALRRYLNPTSGARIDPRLSAAQMLSPPVMPSASLLMASPLLASTAGAAPGAAGQARSTFTASIQLQTYRVRRSRHAPPSSRSSSSGPGSTPPPPSGRSPPGMSEYHPFGQRQRELRENSDFIRIAVMEMAMRRVGKLDDRKPGRARLALPPRKMDGKPYVVGADGVPARWASVVSSNLE